MWHEPGSAEALARLSGRLSRVGRPVVVGGSLVLVALIAAVDTRAEPLLALSVFYLIPVLVAAARDGASGSAVAVVTAATWCAVDLTRPAAGYAGPAVPVANAAMRLVVFGVVVWLVTALRARLRYEEGLGRVDQLTGLASTRAFYEAVEAARRTLARTGRPVTIAYLDLDDFKQVNDRLGHAAGDDVLRRAGRLLAEGVRAVDTTGRLGGDEFGICLPDTDGVQAAAVLERVRTRVAEGGTGPEPGVPRLGVSIGAVTFTAPVADVDTMIAEADRVMYDVKRAGKGDVRLVAV